MTRRERAWAIVVAGIALAAASSCGRFGTDVDPSGTPDGSTAPDGSSTGEGGDPDDPDGGQVSGLEDAEAVPCSSTQCAPGFVCVANQCPVVFASGPGVPVGVAVSKDYVYYLFQEGLLYKKAKTVAVDSLPGVEVPVTAPNNSDTDWKYLSRSNNTLYWGRASNSPPNLMSVPIDGADVVGSPISFPNALSYVAVGGVQYASRYDESVYKLDSSLATPVVSWPNAQVEGLATDGIRLFAARNNQHIISRITPPTFDTDIGPEAGPAGLDVNLDYVYATDQNQGFVLRVGAKGGPREDIAQMPNTIPHGIAVDATHIYWTMRPNSGGTGYILRVRKP